MIALFGVCLVCWGADVIVGAHFVLHVYLVALFC